MAGDRKLYVCMHSPLSTCQMETFQSMAPLARWCPSRVQLERTKHKKKRATVQVITSHYAYKQQGLQANLRGKKVIVEWRTHRDELPAPGRPTSTCLRIPVIFHQGLRNVRVGSCIKKITTCDYLQHDCVMRVHCMGHVVCLYKA